MTALAPRGASISPPASDDPRRCQAHTSTGKPCRKWAVVGATVCPTHGGSAPQVKKAAARRTAEREAGKWLLEQDVTPVDDPIGAYKLLTSSWAAKVKYHAHRGDHQAADRAAAELRACLEFQVRVGLDERARGMDEVAAAELGDFLAGLIRDLLRLGALKPEDEGFANRFVHARLLAGPLDVRGGAAAAVEAEWVESSRAREALMLRRLAAEVDRLVGVGVAERVAGWSSLDDDARHRFANERGLQAPRSIWDDLKAP